MTSSALLATILLLLQRVTISLYMMFIFSQPLSLNTSNYISKQVTTYNKLIYTCDGVLYIQELISLTDAVQHNGNEIN